jgi:predicted nucleotidyltransferase
MKGRSVGVVKGILSKLIEKKSEIWDLDRILKSQSRTKLQAVVNSNEHSGVKFHQMGVSATKKGQYSVELRFSGSPVVF